MSGTSPTSVPPGTMLPGVPIASLSVTPVQGNRVEGDHGLSMGAPAQTRETPPAKPYLFDDIDPVLLVRAHGQPMMEGGMAPASEAALEAGQAAYDASFLAISAKEYEEMSEEDRAEYNTKAGIEPAPTPPPQPPAEEPA